MMGFPDDFIFLGSKVEIARQIGNAVPPALGGAIAIAWCGLILSPLGAITPLCFLPLCFLVPVDAGV